jgi:hypothetical protein
MTIDRRLLEAQLRQIAASADATKAAAEALLKQLEEEGVETPGSGGEPRRPGEEQAAASHEEADRPTGEAGIAADARPAEADDGPTGEPGAAPAADTKSVSAGDEAAARLVAMKLALDGVPREEAEKQLAEQYELTDPAALLAEVYEKAGK